MAAGLMVLLAANVSAQSWNKFKEQAKDKANEVKSNGLPVAGLSEDEIGKGLKEALNQGVKKGVEQLNKKDGYLKDPKIKIPMPDEAKKVEDKLRALGQGAKVDALHLRNNEWLHQQW